ncbi:MAG: SDR family oxidoreductase [Nitrospinota bacterium]|nr:SDR family oxidoreductase [Nitrospinota bacterium]
MPAAIVTGGAVRLGRAFACHLAENGFDIALHYHSSTSAAEEALSKIHACGVRCQGYPCDFKNLQEVQGFMENAIADFPDISLLVNSAANFIQENVEHTSTQTLVDTFNINLLSPYLLMREYKSGVNRGMVINILDQRILKNIPSFAAYSVAKTGLAHLTRLAAVEWGKSVRVNGIAPGLILPPAGETGDYLKRNAKTIPTASHGSLSDLLKALDYLLNSPFVNGEVLFVDGGESKNPSFRSAL